MTDKRTLNKPGRRANAEQLGRYAHEKRSRRYTYTNCLRDEAPTPTGANGTTLYQLLTVGGVVVFTVTANGVRNDGADFLEQYR